MCHICDIWMYMPQTKRITDTHIFTCIHTHLHTGIHVCTYTHINTKILRNMNIYTYTHTYLHTYTHKHPLIYMHVPIHIHSSLHNMHTYLHKLSLCKQSFTQTVKNPPTTLETRVAPWVAKIPWRREW